MVYEAMIRVTQVSTHEGLDDIIGMLNGFDSIAYGEFQDVVNEVEPALIAELSDTPGKVKYPIAWTSEKQRRAFFASDGFGRGIPTQRTGKVQAGWKVTTDKIDGVFRVRIENSVGYSRYVYGTLGKVSSNQQQFHKNTGWQPAKETTDYWLDVIADEYRERMSRIVATRIKRRGYTR